MHFGMSLRIRGGRCNKRGPINASEGHSCDDSAAGPESCPPPETGSEAGLTGDLQRSGSDCLQDMTFDLLGMKQRERETRLLQM